VLRLKIKTARREKVLELSPGNRDLIHYLDSDEVKYPFGCRSASCGVCRAKVHEGLDLLEDAGELEEDTLNRCGATSSTHRLMCRTRLKKLEAGQISIESEDDG